MECEFFCPHICRKLNPRIQNDYPNPKLAYDETRSLTQDSIQKYRRPSHRSPVTPQLGTP
jgi:hypothetical protein